MPLLVFFLIWYFGFARNNPNTYKKIDGKVGKIITALILFSVFGSFIPSFFGLSIALIVLLVTFSPVIIFFSIIAKLFGIGKNKNKGYKDSSVLGAVSSAKANVATGLTRSVPKRKKILKKFNKKYGLNLLDEEIDRIVDASYLYLAWEKEIYDMQNNYDTISQWYVGNTGWLRAYMKVFPVHTISSDFARQREICLETFTQIFDEINPGSFGTVEDCIEAINNEYFSSFDETTFMVVYRFLEGASKKYNLPSLGIIRNESELDKLRKKYDRSVDAMKKDEGRKLKI